MHVFHFIRLFLPFFLASFLAWYLACAYHSILFGIAFIWFVVIEKYLKFRVRKVFECSTKQRLLFSPSFVSISIFSCHMVSVYSYSAKNPSIWANSTERMVKLNDNSLNWYCSIHEYLFYNWLNFVSYFIIITKIMCVLRVRPRIQRKCT